jgi:hypothetical protein
MQAFLVALLTSAIFTGFLSSLGFMGSCFEGSCGYAAILATIPLTLVTFPFWRSFAQRWAHGLRILIWLPIATLGSMLLFESELVSTLCLLFFLGVFALEVRYIRQRGMSWSALFVQARPVKEVVLR